MKTMASDKDIINGCLKGDKRYQKLLFDRYASVLLPVCMRYSNNRQEAEDILQEGFIKIFENLKRFRKEGSLEAWMKKIVVNTALNYYRANLKHFHHQDVDDYAEILPGSLNSQKQIYPEDIMELIRQMPIGYRTVFNMFDIEGYSHKEIAKKLGITENTSKTQHCKARKLLQKWLADYEESK